LLRRNTWPRRSTAAHLDAGTLWCRHVIPESEALVLTDCRKQCHYETDDAARCGSKLLVASTLTVIHRLAISKQRIQVFNRVLRTGYQGVETQVHWGSFSQDLVSRFLLPLPPIGERSVVMTVCVCLCVSVREHISGSTRPILTKFLCTLPMAVARSSSGGVAIRYVLPVLWMTSYLRISRGSSTWPPS